MRARALPGRASEAGRVEGQEGRSGLASYCSPPVLIWGEGRPRGAGLLLLRSAEGGFLESWFMCQLGVGVDYLWELVLLWFPGLASGEQGAGWRHRTKPLQCHRKVHLIVNWYKLHTKLEDFEVIWYL